jgi:hypothetical protein
MSKIRQSIGCMVGGVMIVGPLIPWFLPSWGWDPKPIVAISLVSMTIIGIMIMYDEIREVILR